MIYVFNSFILGIISKTLKYTTSVLLEIHILLNRSSRVLQILLFLSKLTVNGQLRND